MGKKTRIAKGKSSVCYAHNMTKLIREVTGDGEGWSLWIELENGTRVLLNTVAFDDEAKEIAFLVRGYGV